MVSRFRVFHLLQFHAQMSEFRFHLFRLSDFQTFRFQISDLFFLISYFTFQYLLLAQAFEAKKKQALGELANEFPTMIQVKKPKKEGGWRHFEFLPLPADDAVGEAENEKGEEQESKVAAATVSNGSSSSCQRCELLQIQLDAVLEMLKKTKREQSSDGLECSTPGSK